MPKVLIPGIVLLLLLGAGYATIQAARAIPWDCSNWQAFAHADRTTAILESLAETGAKPFTAASTSLTLSARPKPGRPAKTATSGTIPSIPGNAAFSAALSPPKRDT